MRRNRISLDAEYAALNAGFIQNAATINILVTTMYILCLSIFTLVLSTEGEIYVVLLNYIFLFPFQLTIIKKRMASVKISTYISIFLEDEDQMSWATINGNFNLKKGKRSLNGQTPFVEILSKSNSSILGILTSGMCIIEVIVNPINSICIKFIFSIVSGVLLLAIIRLNINEFENDKWGEVYSKRMKEYKYAYRNIKKIRLKIN